MRGLALVVRAGAVVAAIAFVASLVVDGPPAPVSLDARVEAAVDAPATPDEAPEGGRPAAPTAQTVITIAAVGDIAMGFGSTLPPGGARAFFDDVAADLAGDVVLGGLTGTLSTGGRATCRPEPVGCVAIQAPTAYAQRLRDAGFTVLTLANEHTLDFGRRGRMQTVRALREREILVTGGPGEIAVQRVGKTRVAVAGFGPFDWSQPLTDVAAAQTLVRRASSRADVVIVTMHAGTDPAPVVTSFARAVVAAGADLVVGQGVPVLGGIEWYRGRMIAYSLGSFAAYGLGAPGAAPRASAILRLTLRSDGTFENGLLVPTRRARGGVPDLDPGAAAQAIIRDLSGADFGARAARISSTGAIGPPG